MSSTQHWDNYWQLSVSVNSFAESQSALGYQGEVLKLWHQQLAELAPRAVTVDIGTGNGAVAILMQQYSDKNQLDWSITGIDLAKIDPVKSLAQQPELSQVASKISFIPHCSAEKMPFSNGSVDFLTSQFAIEYAQLGTALEESHRVLKKGGSLVAVMHHADSEISRESKAGKAVLSLFLLETNFFNVARQLCQKLIAAFNVDADAELAVECQTTNKQLLELAQRIKSQLNTEQMYWFDDVMAKVGKLMVNFLPENLYRLNFLEKNLYEHFQRLQEQERAALDADKVDELSSAVDALGGSCSVMPISIEGKLFGWLFQYKK